MASGMGTPASRHRAPNTTAARPIIDPTERSIPPVMMMGVKARARRPTSTASRVISMALAVVRKLLPATLKSAPSRASTRRRTHSPLGKSRCRSGASVCTWTSAGGGEAWLSSRPSSRSEASAARMIAPWMAFSQNGLIPAKVRAGPMVPRSPTPTKRAEQGAAAHRGSRSLRPRPRPPPSARGPGRCCSAPPRSGPRSGGRPARSGRPSATNTREDRRGWARSRPRRAASRSDPTA